MALGFHSWSVVLSAVDRHIHDVCPCTEGVLTCVVSVMLFFLIADFPEEAKWLTPAEKDFVKRRLQEDVGSSQRDEKITVRYALSVLSDCEHYTALAMRTSHVVSDRVIVGGFMYFGLNVPAYGYGQCGSSH